MTGMDEVATADQQFIYRAIFSDDRVQETQPRTFRPGQPRFVGVAQLLARKFDPGVVVVRLIRAGTGDWSER